MLISKDGGVTQEAVKSVSWAVMGNYVRQSQSKLLRHPNNDIPPQRLYLMGKTKSRYK